jgi:hypothetical protein
MRGHEKYIEKVHDEAAIYLQHIRTGCDLEPRFQDAFEKVEVARSWIRDGYSDTQVIMMLRNDPATKLQARRAREVINIAYEVFADIRLGRNPDGVKQKYADEINEMALKIKNEIDKIIIEKGDKKEISVLMKEWKSLKKEAATIDGAYLATQKAGSKGAIKPTKVVFKRKTIIKNGNVLEDNIIEDAEYEVQR